MNLQTVIKSEHSSQKIQPHPEEVEYESYLNSKKPFSYQKKLLGLNGYDVFLTQKQIDILKFVAKGFSNGRIAKELRKKESAIKLSIYRTMKYLEIILDKNVDRFSLIIIAQELDL